MSIISAFAGTYSALDYAYGLNSVGLSGPGGAALQVGVGNAATGAGTITVVTGITATTGGAKMSPLNTNAPITVGIGSNSETVTPTAISANNLGSAGPGPNSVTISATFSNLHGPQENVTSGTFGLQEAINAAVGNGGGRVVVTAMWYTLGGTVAILQAAVLPSNGTVVIVDVSTGSNVIWATSPNSFTVVSAPSAATSATVASQVGVVGTWTATTEHVLFTYVTADGGESLASADYSFTATVSLAIGGSGPAASTGAVGYRVYIGTNATTACYLVPVTAANGTVIQCGPIAAFKIGTAFSVATATVAAALIPVQSTAFPAGVQPVVSPSMAQAFASVQGPFAVTGSVTSTATEMGKVQLPLGFLNQVGRTLRLRLLGSWTPAGTAKITLAVTIYSVYTGTATTIFTTTSAASSGAAIANFDADIVFTTITKGAAGTVECHGKVVVSTATATPTIAAALVDAVQAVSGAIDLTKQDALAVTIVSDATVTTSQLRIMVVETLV